MKIGIDISQLAYKNTGVANYLQKLVEGLVKRDTENEYIFFFSSLRKSLDNAFICELANARITFKLYRLPPSLLDVLWNKWHILPVEQLIGDVDIFITSDWTEPPTKRAKKMTILYDLIVYRYPDETAEKIVQTQKRKLAWVKKESAMVLCISEATKKDATEILGIDADRLRVVYPGI